VSHVVRSDRDQDEIGSHTLGGRQLFPQHVARLRARHGEVRHRDDVRLRQFASGQNGDPVLVRGALSGRGAVAENGVGEARTGSPEMHRIASRQE